MYVPARLQSGKGLLLVGAWCLIGNGFLVCCAAVADLAAGGDFLARWIPGGGASQVEPWVGGPPFSRLLAIGVGGLAGFSLARARLGWQTAVLVGLLVTLPWLRQGVAFVFAVDALALQPFLPVPFWALGLVVGTGIAVGWHRKYGPVADETDEPTTAPNTWIVGAALVLVMAVGAGEAGARWAAHVSWNGYVDRLREQVSEENCSADAIWRVAFVQSHAPELVVARVAGGCEALEPPRGPRDRPAPTVLEPIRRAPPRNSPAALIQPLAELGEEEKAHRLAIVYQAFFGGSVERSRGGLARAATTIDAVRGTDVPTVVLDAGGLTNISLHLGEEGLQDAGRRANAVLDAVEVIGFDAICPSRGDLAMGVDWLQLQASLRDLPYTSANLLDANGHRVFPSHVLVQAGTWRVGVLCVTAPNPACGGCEVTDGTAAARQALGELAALRPDVTICLGDLYGFTGVKDTDLVQDVEGIDLYLGSSSSSGGPLERVGDTIVSRTRSKGMRLELLTLSRVLGGSGFHSAEAAAQAAIYREKKAKELQFNEDRLMRQDKGNTGWIERQIDAGRAELASLDAVDHSPEGHHLVEQTHVSVYRAEEAPQIAAILDRAAQR